MGEIRVIDRIFAFGADVSNIKTEGGDICLERFLQFKTAVIGAERDDFTGQRGRMRQGLLEPGRGRFRFFGDVFLP